jgi:hypothetical protein
MFQCDTTTVFIRCLRLVPRFLLQANYSLDVSRSYPPPPQPQQARNLFYPKFSLGCGFSAYHWGFYWDFSKTLPYQCMCVVSEPWIVATVCVLWLTISLCNPSPQLTEIRSFPIDVPLFPRRMGGEWLTNFAIALSQSILDLSRTNELWHETWQPSEAVSGDKSGHNRRFERFITD